jgi:hypothetical protein
VEHERTSASRNGDRRAALAFARFAYCWQFG